MSKKYLVVELINTTIDACEHHESGIATISDGGDSVDIPWLFVKSPLLDSRKEAEEVAKELCRNQYEELKEDLYEESGWFIGTGCPDINDAKMWIGTSQIYSLFICKDVSEDEISEIWLYNYKIIEVDV